MGGSGVGLAGQRGPTAEQRRGRGAVHEVRWFLSSTALRVPDFPPQSLMDFFGQDKKGREQQKWAEEAPVQS